jgi:hypothetical protein
MRLTELASSPEMPGRALSKSLQRMLARKGV